MARKKPEDSGGGPNWLDTYADMVTLMLTFFVMLFALSTMDSSKWKQLVVAFANNKQPPSSQVQQAAPAQGGPTDSALEEALAAASGSPEGNASSTSGKMDFDDLYQYIKNYVDSKGLGSSVEVHKGDGYTFITFQNSIFFNGDSAVLLNDGKTILDYICNGIKDVSDQVGEIRFYGHTARANDQKTQEDLAFDRKLSTDRASNVLLYVQYKNIINPQKMVSEGYGEYRPLVPDDGTEATRVKNRRVEIYISKSGNVARTLDDIYSQINSSGKAAVTSQP
jgi:chemotaxis protein MotB